MDQVDHLRRLNSYLLHIGLFRNCFAHHGKTLATFIVGLRWFAIWQILEMDRIKISPRPTYRK